MVYYEKDGNNDAIDFDSLSREYYGTVRYYMYCTSIVHANFRSLKYCVVTTNILLICLLFLLTTRSYVLFLTIIYSHLKKISNKIRIKTFARNRTNKHSPYQYRTYILRSAVPYYCVIFLQCQKTNPQKHKS